MRKAECDQLRKQIAQYILVAKLGLPVNEEITKQDIINALNIIDIAERFSNPLSNDRDPQFNIHTAQEYLANRLNIS
jgi:hypothetical protein